ncbi:MAG: ECF transporter S component [Clostridiales bacterium]|nr:ECF transporter S component [Clostridiales bacterium]
MKGTTRNITVAAMLSAAAFILMFIEFPIPIMPSFVKLDISDLPALLGTFALGPVYGVVIELLKNLLHILIKGTSSAGVGELCNFLFGAVFALVAGLIYHYKKTRMGAILGSVLGALAMALISIPLNYFVVYPAYVVFYSLPLEAIIGMYQAILPSVGSLLECLVIFNFPFTLCKGLLDALLCFLIYKPLSPLLHGRK